MAKFFEQLGGAPAIAAFTNGDWTDYVEECFEEAGCQEIGLVAFMFFFELFIFLCCSQFPSMFSFANLFSIIPFLIC